MVELLPFGLLLVHFFCSATTLRLVPAIQTLPFYLLSGTFLPFSLQHFPSPMLRGFFGLLVELVGLFYLGIPLFRTKDI